MAFPREKIATLVILDMECTGLIHPGARPRMTELCLLSVQREELLTPLGLPRVCNKMVMCINPNKMIDPAASQVTGIYKFELSLNLYMYLYLATHILEFLYYQYILNTCIYSLSTYTKCLNSTFLTICIAC
jgi:hypothetical protein